MSATLEMQRSLTAQNSYQGDWPRVLCVCTAGLLRSPTIALVLSQPPYNCNTRSAGSEARYALITVDQVLLNWAHAVIFANQENLEQTKAEWALPKQVYCLDLPDRFPYRDDGLVKAIQAALQRVEFPRWTPQDQQVKAKP